jgi:23S rRNA (pseudouridine1915-N3)-methyltransferase
MEITIIAIGKIKERYIQSGIDEFLKRLKVLAKINIIELKDEGLVKESEKLKKYHSQSSYILDADGKQFSSIEIAQFMRKQDKLTLIIGGHDGFSDETKRLFKSISLSKMTFTHEMARLLLIEQIYRSCMINSGRTYYNK